MNLPNTCRIVILPHTDVGAVTVNQWRKITWLATRPMDCARPDLATLQLYGSNDCGPGWLAFEMNFGNGGHSLCGGIAPNGDSHT